MSTRVGDSHMAAEPGPATLAASGDAVPSRYIVALDFGTSHSGFAFCRKDDPDHIVTFMTWPDQPTPYPKTLTAILYNEHLEPIAWGHSANVMYSKQRAPGYQYFSHFKLYLDDEYAAEHAAPEVPVDRLIADYLRLMGGLIEDTMKSKFGDQVQLADAQWCLTVPAMWSDRAKQVMRNAAAQAGLIDSPTSDRLTLVLEPEAAAATMLQGRSDYLQPGDTFIVFDAGGGTVDLTAQQYQLDPADGPCFHEVAPGIGKSCGSTFVDQAFISYLRTTVGAAAFDAWTSASPLGLLQLLHHWETCKRSFVGPPYRDPQTVHDTIAIPSALRKRMTPDTLAALASTQDDDSDSVHLTNFALMHIFDALLKSHPASKILCVGGFAQSSLLINRMRMEVEGADLQVYCPVDPGSAVVRGAVQFGGWKPHMPVTRRVYDARVGRYMATGKVFDALVKFGDVVRPESVVTRVYRAPDFETRKLALELWASTEVSPVFCDEDGEDGKCVKLADFMVPLGQVPSADVDLAEAVAKGPKRSALALPRVEVGLQFGNAEIRVSAKNLDTGVVTQVQVDFSDADVDLSKVGRRRGKHIQNKRPISVEFEDDEEWPAGQKQKKCKLDGVFGMLEGIEWDFMDPMSDEVELPPPPIPSTTKATWRPFPPFDM
ncbi:hypothetical protein BCR44DRAFT_1511975 [Catenaria anguillulae PL171]|uniref:Actin-like ATPase domain-containing protein n=1 Tax=Catenaria anguillulae PL171 TaxID=765915 RepID=A0A1Y2HQQ4_9FUNG|nr:hypothetical protein BCR44DRAFT_1511975 [Catenaria anguillulae PL171]